MEDQEKMDLILGIGPKVTLSPDVTKTLRVGTLKQIKEVGALYKDGLTQLKYAAVFQEGDEQKATYDKWSEILNIVFIEGFDGAEIEEYIPEVLEEAVDRFLFSKSGAGA
ncbi:hypothetical protein P40081_15340 [Paenibacillus sp. FSL P4-0081]|uniref:hypothetical protein n=1 Tax=Paenibacillus sp. FSL P4-0081 TaxID=1536769 RepID=UPI0004F90A27|nr:hypothetical protein [Paenibacillus sp. FSL P4-0081]AIQ29371.1 hypothetical protein P40081_15340 [Paenibacillus sp. FSL P4-0081]